MFSSVLTRSELPRRRLGAGLAAALLVHATGLALLARASTRPPAGPPPVAITFARPRPPPPPPAASPAAPQAARPVPPRPVARTRLVPPKAVPAPEIPEAPPASPPPPESAGEVGGEPGGVAGGSVGGVSGGVASSISPVDTDPAARVDFDESMAPPRLVSGPNIQYSAQALEREVEGLMVVKCVVTVEGAVHDCRVLKGLPYMDAVVVSALERRRYAPATLHGRPLDVNYTFKIRLVLPR